MARRLLSLLLLALPAGVPASAAAQSLSELAGPRDVGVFDLPEGFAQQLVASGFTGATGMAVAPDGRVFVCEQTGALRVVKDDRLLAEPFVRLDVDSTWERGLIGVTLDPDFARNGSVYVVYVSPKPYPHHVVSRFTADGDRAAAGSEVVLLEGDDQTKLGGSIPAGHQGGGIRFGKDGKLYVALGEQTAGEPAQRLDTFQGKLLRINPDGSVPGDNPFSKTARGKYRAIWAYGLRNPFGLAVQPGTGRMFVNDVGASRWEEVDEAAAGANYGWPLSEGPTDDARFRAPVHAYSEGPSESISGGVFYEPPANAWQFPDRYVGKYFFADFILNWVRVIDPERPGVAEPFAAGLAGPVALEVAPDGCLYVLDRNAWVKDGQFKAGTGTLHRIFHVANSVGRPAPVVTRPPEDVTAAAGEGATFRVRAVGAGPLRYQWLRDGKAVEAAGGETLALKTTGAGDDGAVFRCVVSNAFGQCKSAGATLHVATLREPDGQGASAAGLNVAYYQGTWDRVPDFDALRPLRSETVPDLDGDRPPRDAGSNLSLRGAIRIDRDGAYTFRLETRGAANLFISCAAVASVGMHNGPRRSAGTVGLKTGRHSFRLDGAGARDLNLTYSGPGLPERSIPADHLSHALQDAPRAARVLATTINVPRRYEDLPKRLSETGLFRSPGDWTPEPGVLPYDVAVPQWKDGRAARRWVALPGDARIRLGGDGPWRFPPGTVFVQHFEAAAETRLLVVDGTGAGFGAVYRRRAGAADAERVGDAAGGVTRQDCLACHSRAAGFVLGVNARQLPADTLRDWSRAGLFDPPVPEKLIGRVARLAPVADAGATLSARVRSYLDANCAHCHRPGGVRAEFDARFQTPPVRQNLIGARPVAGDLGIAGARLVSPGDRAKSVLYQRINRRRDAFRMPPLDAYDVDAAAADVVGRWIDSLAPRP